MEVVAVPGDADTALGVEQNQLPGQMVRVVADYVFSFQQTRDFMKKLEDLLSFTLPLYAEEGKTSLTIAVGCTGGHHRSVAVAHALTDFVRRQGFPATEAHRDMARSG